MNCTYYRGEGNYEGEDPMGSYTVDCPTCGGTGLDTWARKELRADRAVDEAWEKNR